MKTKTKSPPLKEGIHSPPSPLPPSRDMSEEEAGLKEELVAFRKQAHHTPFDLTEFILQPHTVTVLIVGAILITYFGFTRNRDSGTANNVMRL